MSAEKISLDTNILVYFVDIDANDRHECAIKLIENLVIEKQDCVLTLQSLCEFLNVVVKKNIASINEAVSQIHDWQTLFPIVFAQPKTLARAIQMVKKHKFSFWDAMLWSTAKEAGASIIYSENFQNNQNIDGLKIINPFAII